MGSQRLDMKRLAIKKLAISKPGALSRRGLMEMHGQITEIDGTEEPEDIWTPICMKYLLTCFFPNNKTEPDDRRFLRSLATGYDMMLKGHNLMAMDVFMQAMKSRCLQIQNGGSSAVGQHLELISTDKGGTVSVEEREVAMRIQRNEGKLARLRCSKASD